MIHEDGLNKGTIDDQKVIRFMEKLVKLGWVGKSLPGGCESWRWSPGLTKPILVVVVFYVPAGCDVIDASTLFHWQVIDVTDCTHHLLAFHHSPSLY
jgi:hypothetical protein